MKQYITAKQLNELSTKGKERLRKWWKPKEGDCLYWIKPQCTWWLVQYDGTYMYDDIESIEKFTETNNEEKAFLPILSIGQMIEFLEEKAHFIRLHDTIHSRSEKQGLVTMSADKGWTLESAFDDKNKDYLNWRTDIKIEKKELCDALWSAVKEKLEK